MYSGEESELLDSLRLPTRVDKPTNTQGLRIVLKGTVEPSIVATNAFCSFVKAVSQSRKSLALLFGYLPNVMKYSRSHDSSTTTLYSPPSQSCFSSY